jgi:hypothetical protein
MLNFGLEGLPLTNEDYKLMEAATQPLLVDISLPIGTTRTWNNPRSGNRGTVKLLQRFETVYEGNKLPCRKIENDAHLANVSNLYKFLVNRCQVAGGSWKIL